MKKSSNLLFSWPFLLGLVCLLVMIVTGYWLYRQQILAFQVTPHFPELIERRGPEPTRVVLPQLKIDVPITSAEIKDGQWPISESGAIHLSQSARPTENSNIVVYGHNLNAIFGPLNRARVGDEIYLYGLGEANFGYRITAISIVSPKNIDLVLPTDREVLTLYTCTGWLDSKRLVIRAEPLQVATQSSQLP